MVAVRPLFVLVDDDAVAPDVVAEAADLLPVHHPQVALQAGQRRAHEVAQLAPDQKEKLSYEDYVNAL